MLLLLLLLLLLLMLLLMLLMMMVNVELVHVGLGCLLLVGCLQGDESFAVKRSTGRRRTEKLGLKSS
jgi:hypothetical protein